MLDRPIALTTSVSLRGASPSPLDHRGRCPPRACCPPCHSEGPTCPRMTSRSSRCSARCTTRSPG